MSSATKTIAKFKRGKVPVRIVLPGGTGTKMNDRVTKIMKKRSVVKPNIPTTFRVAGFDHSVSSQQHHKGGNDLDSASMASHALHGGGGMGSNAFGGGGGIESGHNLLALRDRLGHPNQPNYRFEPYQQHYWRPPRGRYWRRGGGDYYQQQQQGGWGGGYSFPYGDRGGGGGWNRSGGDYYGGGGGGGNYAYRYRNSRGGGGGMGRGGGRRFNPNMQHQGGGGPRGVTKEALDQDLDNYWKHASKSGSTAATLAL